MLYRSTYETAPVFTLMEKVVLSKMRHYIGWMDDEGDGILAPGKCKAKTLIIMSREDHALKIEDLKIQHHIQNYRY